VNTWLTYSYRYCLFFGVELLFFKVEVERSFEVEVEQSFLKVVERSF